MNGIEFAYNSLFTIVCVFLGFFFFFALFKCIKGPGTCDRILFVNMLGTAVSMCIAVLSVMLNEDYLADIAIIYVLINFISVVIVAKVYIPKGQEEAPQQSSHNEASGEKEAEK